MFLLILLLTGCESDPRANGEAETCEDPACFSENVAQCEPAQYTTDRAAGAEARYRIEGPVAEGCQIELVYTEHPDPTWVEQPLRFVVNPDAPFEPQLETTVSECLTGPRGDASCEGPLLELLGGAAPAAAHPVDESPCGVEVEPEGPPLYALPRDGQWGYVDRSGEWIIEPQWHQVQPFSEGRAAVETGGGWGLIDRGGQYVIEPSLQAPTYTTFEGERIVDSPFGLFSAGCASVLGETAIEPPYFVDREGRAWLRDERPQDLAEEDLRVFGSFSEGKASFRLFESGLTDRFGWIDTEGNVVIEPEFTGAGPFVEGLAPAAIDRGQWGFIDEEGTLVLPGKWTLQSAQTFSEGLALISYGNYIGTFIGRDGETIDEVQFVTPREVTIGEGADARTERYATAEIKEAGNFHDGLAPVIPNVPGQNELVYIGTDGVVAFAPEQEGRTVCNARTLPEFRNGLVQLLVADDGSDCGYGAHHSGLPSYEEARYVYFDPSGNVALEQPTSADLAQRAERPE